MENTALTYPQHARAIWKLGLPLILSNMAQFAIHMTDTIMLGWYDVTALAAVTIAATIVWNQWIQATRLKITSTKLSNSALPDAALNV